MQRYLRERIDWPQAFPGEEYALRRAKLREALGANGIDGIYVSIPADLTYLTGYDMIWYHLRNLTGLFVQSDRDDTLFCDGRAHTTIVSTTPEIGEVVWYDRWPLERVIATVADALEARGVAGKTIALQPWSYAPHASVIEALGERLGAAGARVVDGSAMVEEIRLVKSARELAVVREAAALADRAMAAARDAIRPGVSETELEGVLVAAMMEAGGGYPGIRTMIGSGPRSGTHHSAPTQRRLRRGDLVFIDFCACLHRYHVNLNRTFSVGEPDPRWAELMAKSAGCIDAIVEAVEPGDRLGKVQEVGDAYIDAAGLRGYAWYIGGYALGISVPPDWVGMHRVQPTAEVPDRPLEAGMVFNFENQFDVWEDWPGGSGAAYIETLVMTAAGLEVLSELPRGLVAV